MARQGILAKAKPSAATNTVLYSAPIGSSASTVLSVTAQGGAGTTYDVALKDYDQKLTLDASTYLLHEGDVITAYEFVLDQPIPLAAGLQSGTLLTSTTGESRAYFESYVLPDFVSIAVRSRSIRTLGVESVTGNFVVGDVISKGVTPDDTTAVVYAVQDISGSAVLHLGPATINGSGTDFAEGDSVSATGGATATVSVGGIGVAADEYTFQTSGGIESLYLGEDIVVLGDRTYRFDISDSSMTGTDFKLSETVNGEWGPDGFAPSDPSDTGDGGTEYTTGKTTNGTAGSAGAYIQYDFTQDLALAGTLYYYDGDLATAANSNYGGSDRFISTSGDYEYDIINVYDLSGNAWTSGSDGFEFNGTTYTVTSQNSGPYGYVRSFSGTTLYVIKGEGSPDFTATDTFKDCPLSTTQTRSVATVNSVDVATTAYETQDTLRFTKSITANATDEIKSLVVGPGQRVIVNNAAADCSFVLVGFEDTSSSFTTRTFGVEVVVDAASL